MTSASGGESLAVLSLEDELRLMSQSPTPDTLCALYDAMRRSVGGVGSMANPAEENMLCVEARRFPTHVQNPNGDIHTGTIITYEQSGDGNEFSQRKHEMWWRMGWGFELRPVDPPPRWSGYSEFDVLTMIRHLSPPQSGTNF